MSNKSIVTKQCREDPGNSKTGLPTNNRHPQHTAHGSWDDRKWEKGREKALEDMTTEDTSTWMKALV